MKALKANVVRGLPVEARVNTCDNSGAKLLKIFSVVGSKTVKGRIASAGVGDLVMASVKKGKRKKERKKGVY